MSRSVRMVGAALIPAFALPLATGNVARAAVPNPPTNNNLPGDLDVASPYVPQDTCDPVAKPGVLAFARLMASHYSEFNYGISRACTSGVTEHSEGRALDWMLNAYDSHERGVADSVLAWLMAPDAQGRQGAMARRFGIMYVIWDRRIWGTYQMDAGWRPYNGPNPHTDHIHFSFSWDGAMQRTSWWTGKAWTGVSTSPSGPSVPLTPPTSYPRLSEGARGPDVQLAQKVIGTDADGVFGPATKSALISWQRNHSVRATGVLDAATWAKMVALGKVPARGGSSTPSPSAQDTVRLGSRGESVKALQRILGLSVDGVFGSKTNAAVRKFQKDKSLKVNGVVDGNVWKALNGKSYKKTGASGGSSSSSKIPSTVRQGSTGAAVKELQRELGIGVDGIFGSQTASAVRSFQRKKSLKVNGVVDSNVWKALKGMSYKKTGASGGSSSSSKIPSTVRQGSTGAAVKELQRELGIGVDGIFGSQTASAVRSFQRKKSLKVNGVVDSNVWKALKGMSYKKTGTSGDSSSSTKVPETVRQGSRGAAVKKLQRVLDLKADGVFGSQTASAVRSFQRRNSLTADGVVGAKTWEALLGKGSSTSGGSKGNSSSMGDSSKGDSSSSTKVPETVRQGSRGAAVKRLQRILDLKADGVFGSQTASAVRSFQRRNSLTADGVVGAKTWEALLGKGSSTSGGSKGNSSSKGDSSKGDSSSSTKVPETVRQGSRGAAVKRLQRILDLKADGVFGSQTASAVRSFQRRNSLTADGVVGAKTWEALLSRSGGAQSLPRASFLGSAGVATVATSTEFAGLKSMVLAEGTRSAAVKQVQQVVGGVAVDGVFGAATATAVRSFQTAHGLPVTGVVDEQTWDALEATKYPFLAYRTTVLKPGSTGPAVTALQSRLGMFSDGVYGPATEQAVRSLQERNGLTRTGYVGAVTWQALEREVRIPA
ncbi:peptidoglycan-binding domain-containing protein [Janibacter alittae]|uniref:Peptidoglycan-binding protein n=1 Tax=Janibacter alittae TaxID=3115209 RepID=A0ABZ2MEW5_9MICO